MPLTYLEVRDLRNLTSLQFEPCTSLNLIIGSNGSGKTSLLEAVHVLGLGRSFRSAQSQKYIQKGKQQLLIFGRVHRQGITHAIGVQKSLVASTEIHIDRQPVSSAASLAELLPLQLITPESHQLLQGEPRERRAFIDWGLFHVEHNYLQQWKRYRRLLEQRNAALRASLTSREISLWEDDLAESGQSLTASRRNYLLQLTPYFEHIYRSLLDEEAPSLSYRQGWSKEIDLLESYRGNRDRELSLGYTLSGPHRADFRLRLDNGLEAVDGLSRGQQKLTVCALRLAQMQHLYVEQSVSCTLLLDDLPAELDSAHRGRLLAAVQQTGAQCFITATEPDLIDVSLWAERKVFHVEHGVVKEVI